ncbi:MAG: serpin family protein [Polyangiaceae bacterium]|nr:serpin family protein [Polyangiaceae bacterium]
MKKLADSSNAFGFDYYKRLQTKAGNLIWSPASLSTALAMTWGGAKGETAAQMKKVLHLEGAPKEVMDTSGRLTRMLEDPSRPVTFRIANQLFGEKTYTFQQPFLDQTKDAYGAPLELVDFKTAPDVSRIRVNGWVDGETAHRVKDLIPPGAVDENTRLILVNAIYFLGNWAQPFEKGATSNAAFHISKSESKQVPTMHNGGDFRFAEKDGLKAVELPYKGEALAMTIIIPDAVDGLPALEKSLDAKKLADIDKAMSKMPVAVSLPKFEVSPAESLDVGKDLVEMGMKDAFTRGKADFTLMADPPVAEDRLLISKVFHKAFVRVDEQGTEAAGASAVIMQDEGAAAKYGTFEADHPFLFLIRDKASGLVLFMGRVADPTAK